MKSRLGRPAAALSVVVAASALVAGAAGPPDLHGTTRSEGRAVANAVVWLDAPKAPSVAPARRVVLDQRNLQFSPHVLVVRVGTAVEFPNNDRVFHNVFSFRDGKVFNLGMYPVGAVKRVTFDRPGLSRIFCNIHPGMAAYVMAVASPYFAVSDETGAFTISAVDAGTYTYHAWRAGGADLTGSWTVGNQGPLAIEWP